MAHYRRPDEPVAALDATSAARREHGVKYVDALDAKMGFARFDEGAPRTGWLVNFQPTTAEMGSEDAPNGKSAVDFYFLDEDGGYFKATLLYCPYFYVQCSGREGEVDEFLKRKLQSVLKASQIVQKDDLSLPNHLVGNQVTLIQLFFHNVQDLLSARRLLMPLVAENQKRLAQLGVPDELVQVSPGQLIIAVKEHDVPYHVRVCIDLGIRVGKWYTVHPPKLSTGAQTVSLTELTDRLERADPVVMAFDIETTKLPLKFPDAKIDSIMMISYMIDGRGFLITNREIVSQDIEDFEYTPKPEFKGEFTIFNELNERDLIVRFFEHIRDERPTVIATYNGDSFDWPFVAARAAVHGLDMYEEIGFQVDSEGEYKSSYCVHMDCFRWVKRDSYLPQGSQGLKAVTTAKLGYNPLEIDPELMTPYAQERPQVLSEYSVSDAVATYYLYMKYVHPFIFSLCTILPLRPDEVLRKGTGTLCEMLLMVQAYIRNIVLPHKHSDPPERYYNGHLVESETYVGGHVESLEAGVFRADIATDFSVSTDAVDELLDQLDAALTFTIVTELKLDLEDVVNYEEVKNTIRTQLLELKEKPKRHEEPLIYHVDVASMYPNIMTSNRLQPDSMKSERDCAMCDFNVPGKTCDRRLPWAWRGEFFPAKKGEILMIQDKLRNEMFPKADGEKGWRTYEELTKTEQIALQRRRIADYSRKVYHKIRDSETVEREAIICQRENPFYVNTVRDFRDRRYDFKGKQKTWKQNLSKSKSAAEKEYAAKMVVLFDSLQLAHKVILNSFYGYVMRKGSRWYSMEMAGVTCLTGATIIQLARSMVERLGRPLELDTDGIWCILPKSFPGDLDFVLKSGKKIQFAYPCVMLNHLVHEKFTNHQYQTLVDEKKLIWETSSDNTIFFEVDGPYKAMMLPSSREEGKGLKKRYAVFNFDGTLAELKGFELKRRGELQLIKTFQSQLFSKFLEGSDLASCYTAVASVANSWLDVLDSKGSHIEDVDLMNLISENKSMSKSLEEYGAQKSSSICTARRLADFLGKEMVKDKGLACRYIISADPVNEPVTNRAIPIQIFDAPPAKKQEFLRKWLKKPHLEVFDIRGILDWDYYRERLAATIQKLVVIPAARQKVPNPVPRVQPPAWLARQIANENDTMKQQVISFAKTTREKALQWGAPSPPSHAEETLPDLLEIEDAPGSTVSMKGTRKAVVKRKATMPSPPASSDDEIELSPKHAPNPDVNYGAWVMYMKRVWKKQREEFLTREQLFGSASAGKRSRGIHGLIRKQTETLWKGAGGVWQILQIQASSDPGKVRVVASVNGRLQNISVIVPRQVFLLIRSGHSLPRSVLSNPKLSFNVSDAIMPSGQTSNRLYRLVMSEQQFQDEQTSVDGLFKCRAIEEVFEKEITARDRVLLKLGGHCRLGGGNKPGLLGKGLDTGFDLEWLERVEPSNGPQGEPDSPTFSLLQRSDYVVVVHSEVHGRHFITTMESWGSRALTLECSPRGSDKGDDWAPHLNTEYEAQLQIHHPEQTYFAFASHLKVEKQVVANNVRKFWSLANKALAELASERSGNVIALVSCDRSLSWLSSRLRICRDIPALEMSGGASRAKSALPSIGWQVPLARRIAKTYLRSQAFLDSLRVMAAHTNIPIGNLPSSEDTRHAIDVTYARRLQEAHHVLWWGDSVKSSPASFAQITYDETGRSQADIDDVGVYAHVCLDMSVSNLVVSTILTSSFLLAAEGGTSIADPDFLADAFSPVAWQCLVDMTKEWWQRASNGDEAADICVQQLSGWIVAPSSRLWSPKLAHEIKALSDKALSQLAQELRKFGTTVVHSERDGQRIVLATTKKSAATALGFGGLVVKETKTKDQFAYLDISVNEVWDFLIWMNSTNYGGRLLRSNSSTVMDSLGEMEYHSTWQIAGYLPPILQDEFDEWVLQYMAMIAQQKDTSLDSENSQGGHVKMVPADFMKGSLLRLEKPLCNRVSQLQSRYIDAVARHREAELFSTPNRAGLQPTKRPEPPVLAFVKTLLAVLKSTNETTEFIRIRRSLLNLLQVGDFDSASEFRDPAAKLVVRDLICMGCMACVDIDVCHPEQNDSNNFVFKCPRCGSVLDRVMMEEKLVQMLMSTVALFQLQDLKCVKCGKIRPNDMAEYCPCSGQFKNTITVESTQRQISIFRHIGKFYDLRLLNDAITQI